MKHIKPQNNRQIVLRSLSIGLAGGIVGWLIKMPLAWMLGPMLLTIIVSLAGVKCCIPSSMSKIFKGIVGIILGTAINTETVERIVDWPVSIGMVALGILLTSAVVSLYYRRIAKFDLMTSAAAALPGSITSLPAIAINMGAHPQRTILPQLLRVALVVTCVPPIYLTWQGIPSFVEPELTEPQASMLFWVGEELWILLFAPLGWYIAQLIKIPVPQMLGPMLITAGFTLAGFEVQLPVWLIGTAFLVLGTGIGARFYGMPFKTVFTTGRHALAGTLLGFAGIAIVGVLIHSVTGVPLPVAMLAVTPGGIAEMALLAAALGVDPVFVTFHQVTRTVVLNFVAPFIFNWITRRSANLVDDHNKGDS